MGKVLLKNVSVDFPVFGYKSRSFKMSALRNIGSKTTNPLDGGTKIVSALRQVNLELGSGDRLAVLGSNGAGKTTLLRTIAGAYFPTGGEITVSGKVTSLLDLNMGISRDLTGYENVQVRGLLSGLSSEVIRRNIDSIAEFSELGEFLEMPVRTYSDGMILRLAFSISTILSPEILVMDEWLSVGDEAFRDKANAKLREFVSNSEVLVLATHSKETAQATCNRGVVLSEGTIAFDGTIEDAVDFYWWS